MSRALAQDLLCWTFLDLGVTALLALYGMSSDGDQVFYDTIQQSQQWLLVCNAAARFAKLSAAASTCVMSSCPQHVRAGC